MKKAGRFILISFALMLIFTFSALAEESKNNTQTIYERQYQSSGAKNLETALPKETKGLLNEPLFNTKNTDEIFTPLKENPFSLIWDFLKNGITAPLTALTAITGIILILSSVDGLMGGMKGIGFSVFVCFLATVTVLEPVYSLVFSVQDTVKAISTFMLTFIPIYAGILISSGKTTTAGSFSALLLGATETISQIVSFGFVPIVGGSMCLGICSGISPISGINRICEWIKKTSVWMMGIATTIFLGVMSMQTSVNVAADNLGIRTSKAILGSLPIMGPAVSETINTARGCLDLLRQGVGIYGVAAILLIILPLVIQLFLWRVCLWLCSGIAEIFDMREMNNLFRSVDFCLAILVGVLIFTAILFTISISQV